MSWSFRLRNGDLTLGQASFGTVTGEEKLVQDLRCYILEQMGTDDMHLNYGALLDGGRLPDGTEIPGFIGRTNDNFTAMEVEAELKRIVNNYQAMQLERARDDKYRYNKVTLSRGEILMSAPVINAEPIEDTLKVTIGLETAAQTNVEFNMILI